MSRAWKSAGPVLTAALVAAAAPAVAQTAPAPFVEPAFLRAERTASAAFETPEYRANIGLSLINASTAYARGWTGAGSLIAVIDNGFQIAHPELGPQVVEAIRSMGGGPVPTASHGTHVAGIAGAARDGRGMHGVAYGARLALYSYGTGPATDAVAFDLAARLRPTVISNSWGVDQPVDRVFASPLHASDPYAALGAVTGDPGEDWRTFVAALRRAQAHSVIVFAGSNSRLSDIDVSAGLPLLFPELRGPWLAVVNVDANGVLRSVHCGSAAQFCLAGPGTDIYSTEFGLTYSVKTGTSMATPHVSGAVAIAREMFPRATPTELASLVLQTATDIGAPGVDDRFGWGMLNLANLAATRDPSAAAAFAYAGASQFAALGHFGAALRAQVWGSVPAASGGSVVDAPALDAPAMGGRARYASLGFDPRGGASLAFAGERAAGIWLAGFHARSRLGAGAAAPASVGRVEGFAAGVDLVATPAFRLGVAAGASRGATRAKTGADTGSADGLHVAAYADWRGEGAFAQAVGQVGFFEQGFVRRSAPGAVGVSVAPVGVSRATSVAAEIDGRFGLAFDLAGHGLQPYLSLVGRWRSANAFTESGAGAFSVAVPASSAAQFEIGPGLRWTSPALDLGAASARIGVDLGYARLMGERAPGFAVELLGTRIAQAGVDPGRHVLRVGSEIALSDPSGRVAASLAWDGRFQRKAESHTLSGRLRLSF